MQGQSAIIIDYGPAYLKAALSVHTVAFLCCWGTPNSEYIPQLKRVLHWAIGNS